MHPWDEPVKRVLLKAQELNVPVLTPMIGEPLWFHADTPTNKWWEL
jgi:hypothetical protein